MSTKAKWILTVVISVGMFLILLLGGFTFTPSESRLKQMIGVALIALLPTIIVFIWLKKSNDVSGKDPP